MAKTPLNLVEDPNRADEFELCPKKPYKSNARSLFAMLFSIFIYSSVIYIFNLSPSSLFDNTTFWFALVLDLIFIITVDYSSSKNKLNQLISYQEEYVMHRQTQITSSFETVPEFPREVLVKEAIIDHQIRDVNRENRQSVFQHDHGDDDEKPSAAEVVVQEKKITRTPKGGNKEYIRAKTFRRCKTGPVAKRVVIDGSKNNTLRRSETMKRHEFEETRQVSAPVEDNEFSTMSDEELNRRVDEFIRRFKSGLNTLQIEGQQSSRMPKVIE